MGDIEGREEEKRKRRKWFKEGRGLAEGGRRRKRGETGEVRGRQEEERGRQDG